MECRDRDPILRSIQLCHLKNTCHVLQLRLYLCSQLNVVVTKQSSPHLNGLLVHQVAAFPELPAEACIVQHGVFHLQRELLHQHRQAGSEELPC